MVGTDGLPGRCSVRSIAVWRSFSGRAGQRTHVRRGDRLPAWREAAWATNPVPAQCSAGGVLPSARHRSPARLLFRAVQRDAAIHTDRREHQRGDPDQRSRVRRLRLRLLGACVTASPALGGAMHTASLDPLEAGDPRLRGARGRRDGDLLRQPVRSGELFLGSRHATRDRGRIAADGLRPRPEAFPGRRVRHGLVPLGGAEPERRAPEDVAGNARGRRRVGPRLRHVCVQPRLDPGAGRGSACSLWSPRAAHPGTGGADRRASSRCWG